MPRKKKPVKRRVGRPAKDKCVKPIPDTPENVAKALFGIKSSRSHTDATNKKTKA